MLKDAISVILEDEEIKSAVLNYIEANTHEKVLDKGWREVFTKLSNEQKYDATVDRSTKLRMMAYFDDYMRVGFISVTEIDSDKYYRSFSIYMGFLRREAFAVESYTEVVEIAQKRFPEFVAEWLGNQTKSE